MCPKAAIAGAKQKWSEPVKWNHGKGPFREYTVILLDRTDGGFKHD